MSAYKLTKKLSVEKPGAIKLAQRYGDALVCCDTTWTHPGRHA